MTAKRLYKKCSCKKRHVIEKDCYGFPGYFHWVGGHEAWAYATRSKLWPKLA